MFDDQKLEKLDDLYLEVDDIIERLELVRGDIATAEDYEEFRDFDKALEIFTRALSKVE